MIMLFFVFFLKRRIFFPIKKEAEASFSWFFDVVVELLHDELHGVLKTVGLHGDEVDAAAEAAGVEGRGVDAGVDADVLVHHLLAHEVVDADAHLRSLRGVHFDGHLVDDGVGIDAGVGHRVDSGGLDAEVRIVGNHFLSPDDVVGEAALGGTVTNA